MVALTACGQQEAPTAAAPAAAGLDSGISLEYMDTSVRPGDDFFSYVNGKWIAETEIPADKASYGGFAILADEAQENLRVIIEESANGDFAKGTDEQKVGDLYNSYLDMESRNARGIEPLSGPPSAGRTSPTSSRGTSRVPAPVSSSSVGVCTAPTTI